MDRRMRKAICVPDGRTFYGQHPGNSFVWLLEHELRDELARRVNGATEVCVPYGHADVLTPTTAFEVEPWKAWRTAVRQTLAYAATSGTAPAIALFGEAHRDQVLKIYLVLRDGLPPIKLWWFHHSSWQPIRSRTDCRNQPAVPIKPTAQNLRLATRQARPGKERDKAAEAEFEFAYAEALKGEGHAWIVRINKMDRFRVVAVDEDAACEIAANLWYLYPHADHGDGLHTMRATLAPTRATR